jgi:putative redox protein
MRLKSKWIEKMRFSAEAGGHSVPMDAKLSIGSGAALTPKELVLAGLCGCTGMDIVALMRKHKQPLGALEVEAEAIPSEGGHPAVFREVRLLFDFRGEVDREKALEAVRLSQTKFCGVSAMLSKAVPIHYEVRLNEEVIGSGQAEFVQEGYQT